jgi:hypothetical protein
MAGHSPESGQMHNLVPPIPYGADRATLEAFDDMDVGISANAHAIDFVARLGEKIAANDGVFVDPVPPDFGDDLVRIEKKFAYEFVGNIFSLVERARAAGVEVKKFVVRTDLDGTVVGHGYDYREILRGGFAPAVEYAAFVLRREGIELGVSAFSDREQAALAKESNELFEGLAKKGLLLPPTSTRNSDLANALPAELKPSQHGWNEEDPRHVAIRAQGVKHIMTPEDAAEHYYDRAAMLDLQAYGPDADPGTVYLALDDTSWVDYIKKTEDNPRVAGMRVLNAPFSQGGIQPPTPGDIYNY